MAAAGIGAAAYAPGTRVRIKDDWPEERGRCHIRTPHYVRGRTGTIERALGTFANPEDLAFARPASRRALYHVRFDQEPLWHEGDPRDTVLIEIFEHWIEPLAEEGTR
jgi:nitrile hydratase